MKIAFHLFDLSDNTFKKVYFREWNDRSPIFCENKKIANKYWSEKLASEDVALLKKATSPTARTLAIRLEEE